MAFTNTNVVYSVLRQVEKSLHLLSSKSEDLNSLSLKSKINYLHRENAKLRKELTRAEKRLKDKDAFISKLMREIGTLKGKNQKFAEENLEYRNKVAKSNNRFLDLKLSYTASLKVRDDNHTTYKKKMEERFTKSVSFFEEKLVQKDNYIAELKSNRSKNANANIKPGDKSKGKWKNKEKSFEEEKQELAKSRAEFEAKQDEHRAKSLLMHPDLRKLYEKEKANRVYDNIDLGGGPVRGRQKEVGSLPWSMIDID
jgi:chromosome segregation ATPase